MGKGRQFAQETGQDPVSEAEIHPQSTFLLYLSSSVHPCLTRNAYHAR